MSEESDRIRAEYARRAAEVSDEIYALTAPAQLQMTQEVERLAIDALRAAGRLPLAGLRILEVGCGWGGWLLRLETWGADREALAGLDLVPARAAGAAAALPGADVREGDATALPWPDASFDVVFQSMMFSSILDADVRRRAAVEIDRVLAPGGHLLWYDFFVSHPRNPNTVGMRRGEITGMFGGYTPALRRATLLPPLARRIAPRSRPLVAALAGLRVLDTHLVGTLRKP